LAESLSAITLKATMNYTKDAPSMQLI
jgi:hypothetical protein